jgi:hypothetical protein
MSLNERAKDPLYNAGEERNEQEGGIDWRRQN